MSVKQKRIFLTLIALGLIYFVLFIFPNSQGAVDQNMLGVFEPDEFAQYPHVVRMLKPANQITESIRRFLAYQHYYYGFPFYFTSALVILPLKWLAQFDTPQIMVTLRQLLSVAPMLAVAFIWVYLQTRFESWLKSVVLFVFLLSIPAVVENNLWWHPESLTILFISLTFLFLVLDDLDFGKFFTLAAISTGMATGTKLIGLFFFLTIPAYIYYGFRQKRISLKQAVTKAALFVALMAVVFVLSNPLLLTASGRQAYWRIQQKQAEAMSFGWQVQYDQSAVAWLPILREYYALLWVSGAAFIGLILMWQRKGNRLLSLLIATWVVPFSLYILLVIAIKPTHFFLPIAIPLLSSLVIGLDIFDPPSNKSRLVNGLETVVFLALAFQLAVNLPWGVAEYRAKLHKVDDSDSVQFYYALDEEYLSQLPQDLRLHTHRDVRLYVPDQAPLDSEVLWGLPDQAYIESNDFDLLLIERQKIRDYTQEDTLENAADPQQMLATIDFYQGVESNSTAGYTMLFENEFGLALLKTELFQDYYSNR